MKTLLLLCLLSPLSLFAATLRVNNAPDTSPDHATIQAAINAATDGDTILIEGSVTPYAGFTLTNKRLNLIGPGYGLPVNLGTPANKLTAFINTGTSLVRTSSASAGSANGTLVMGLEFYSELALDACSNVTVSRCLFNGSFPGRISVSGAGNVISQCFFRGSSPIQLNPSASGVRIENSIIADSPLFISPSLIIVYLNNNLLYGLSASSSSVSCDNNIFLAGSVSSNAGSTFRNNLFPNSLPSGITGSGNLTYSSLASLMPNSTSPTATFDGRYQLSPLTAANPAFNAGTDGTHIGPFGGANPYVLSGIPPLPTIDELSVPQFAAPGNELIIRVKVGERL